MRQEINTDSYTKYWKTKIHSFVITLTFLIKWELTIRLK